MESKYTSRLSKVFPNNFKVTSSLDDSLRKVINETSVLLEKSQKKLDEVMGEYSLNTINPLTPSQAYYVIISDLYDISSLSVTPELNSNSIVTSNEKVFLSKTVTGFDFEEEIIPENDTSYDFIGINRSFDFDKPSFQLSLKEHDSYFKYSDLKKSPEKINYVLVKKDYNSTGKDEYINFQKEYDENGNEIKVAFLEKKPVGDIKIIDTENLINPQDPDSDGITVNSSDYTVNGNKIIFAQQRSDYYVSQDLSSLDVLWFDFADSLLFHNSTISTVADKSNQIQLNGSGLIKGNGNYLYNELKNSGQLNSDLSFNINDEFSLIINGKFENNCEDILNLGFFDNLLSFGVNSDKVILKTEQTQEQLFDSPIYLNNKFITYIITYDKGTFNLYINEQQISTFSINETLNEIVNIKFGSDLPNECKCSDIILLKKSTIDIEDWCNYFNSKNILYNYQEVALKFPLIFNANDVEVDSEDKVIQWKSKGIDSSILIRKQFDENKFAKVHSVLDGGKLKYKYVQLYNNEDLTLQNSLFETKSFTSLKNTEFSIIAVYVPQNVQLGDSISIKGTTLDVTGNLSIDAQFGFKNGDSIFRDNLCYNNTTYSSTDYNEFEITISNILGGPNIFDFFINNEISNRVIVNDSQNVNGYFNLSGKNGTKLMHFMISNQYITQDEVNMINQYLSHIYNVNISNKCSVDYSNIPSIEKRIGPFNNDRYWNNNFIVEYTYKAFKPLRYLTTPLRFYDLIVSEALITNNEEV